MVNKEWRPDDWEDTGIDCYCGEVGSPIHTKEHERYEAGAAAMLEARDKWWIEKIEEYYQTTRGDVVISKDDWQSLKKEIKKEIGL